MQIEKELDKILNISKVIGKALSLGEIGILGYPLILYNAPILGAAVLCGALYGTDVLFDKLAPTK